MTQINQFLISHGGLLLFVTVFVDQTGLPVPVEPILLTAGALAARGKLSLFVAISCVVLGCLAADMIWFYLGLRGQERLFRVFPGWASIKHTIPRGLDTRVILRGMPNPGEILRLDDGREVEVISSGRVDFKAFTWAAPVAA